MLNFMDELKCHKANLTVDRIDLYASLKGTYSQLPTKNLDITSRTEEISNPSATRTRSGAAKMWEGCVLHHTNLISMPKKISSKNIEN